MTHYPLLFTFRDKVSGNGFLADVLAHGQALALKEEPEGWWIESVTPGDFAAGGATFPEAHIEFRKAFTAVLFDIAEDAVNFEAFKTEVEEFFAGTNQPAQDEWKAAVTLVRSGKITAQDIAESFPTRPAESPPAVEIRLLEVPKPHYNVLEPVMELAA